MSSNSLPCHLHLRTHSEARPYLCDMCGYSAKRPHGLTNITEQCMVLQWQKQTAKHTEERQTHQNISKLLIVNQ
ncbi:hypothetical protein EB796_012390 [Bugula neritina]|uniref:C2H2-type domain-containing protein n=1 Tax=Bugula neritina TaxID=10212 RepID=A0A7J7JSJ4_BUGNE|nr:hypothetical protein EB796_012390 [Bugula neritina]